MPWNGNDTDIKLWMHTVSENNELIIMELQTRRPEKRKMWPHKWKILLKIYQVPISYDTPRHFTYKCETFTFFDASSYVDTFRIALFDTSRTASLNHNLYWKRNICTGNSLMVCSAFRKHTHPMHHSVHRSQQERTRQGSIAPTSFHE